MEKIVKEIDDEQRVRLIDIFGEETAEKKIKEIESNGLVINSDNKQETE